MQNLYEIYRPTAMCHVIGQTVAKRQIRTTLKYGWGGKAFIFKDDLLRFCDFPIVGAATFDPRKVVRT